MVQNALIVRAAIVGAVAALAGVASAQPVVFQNIRDNGYFTPFSSTFASGIRYGDSGWLTGPGNPGVGLYDITLGLAVVGSTLGAGTTDITFTFNDGDPSGQVFGPGSTLYSTTITNVTLPDSNDGVAFFDLTIPLPGVVTSGGFNNIGWSIGVSNFNYSGSFGFQVSSAIGQQVGFYTSNASFYNGASWSLFSFGPDPVYGVANYVATVRQVPAPAAAGVLGLGVLAARRRRR